MKSYIGLYLFYLGPLYAYAITVSWGGSVNNSLYACVTLRVRVDVFNI